MLGLTKAGDGTSPDCRLEARLSQDVTPTASAVRRMKRRRRPHIGRPLENAPTNGRGCGLMRQPQAHARAPRRFARLLPLARSDTQPCGRPASAGRRKPQSSASLAPFFRWLAEAFRWDVPSATTDDPRAESGANGRRRPRGLTAVQGADSVGRSAGERSGEELTKEAGRCVVLATAVSPRYS
jgi:hypothetical protein